MKSRAKKQDRTKILITSLVLLSALMFLLGFFIGKNYEQKTPALTVQAESGEVSKSREKPVEQKKEKPEPKTGPGEKFTFYKTLGDTNQSIREEKERLKSRIRKDKEKEVYTIQVGSFKSEAEAKRFRSELIEKGYDAYVVTLDAAGKAPWHRVRIGSFQNKDEAFKVIKSLEKEESLKGFLTEKLN